jgi:hypothetical protein
MHRKANLFQIVVSLLIVASLFPTTVQSSAPVNPSPEWRPPAAPLVPFAAPVVDGVVDAAYGSPIASDPAGDGNSNANMDLLDLYAVQDEDYFYFAFTINADITLTNWGKYVLYIDTDGAAGSGADHDAWGRNVVVSDPHKPEFAIYSWVDAAPYGTEDVQFVGWTGTSWDWDNAGTISAAALSGGGISAIEWKVAKADLGHPETIWVSVWNTGGGDSDNAQDTINNPADDWNATEWSSQAVLMNSTQFGAPLVDGSIDQVYGIPLASDPPDDGNGNAVMDLLDLYVTDDVDYFYFAFTVNADITQTNWGKYALYIDIDGEPGSGATSDAWGRNVVVSDPHKPEFAIYSWVDAAPYGTEDVQFVAWTGTSWDWGNAGTISAAALSGGAVSVIEWKVSKANLGSPNTIWAEVWSTGGGGSDNAQDTINDPPDDWNAAEWSSQAVLLNSTEYTAKVAKDSPPPAAGHDNNVWWDQLYHDSRDSLYRTPGGAVMTGIPVTLRLRAASGDLTEARVRVWNDRLDQQFFVPMQIVVDDGIYEYWEAVLPASSLPTVYWYRFIVIDGTDTDYYEDDNARTGGVGQPFDTSVDNSWQLTVYAADFATPEWIKNAVVYQVFLDRFHDGDSSNNTSPGTFFYDEAGGTVFRSLGTDWNTPVCDPRASGACSGTYSKNFYGGDLQGLLDKLDYLEGLGVTAIYLNPIFESPSNHKYDTTDFMQIDDNFGESGAVPIPICCWPATAVCA